MTQSIRSILSSFIQLSRGEIVTKRDTLNFPVTPPGKTERTEHYDMHPPHYRKRVHPRRVNQRRHLSLSLLGMKQKHNKKKDIEEQIIRAYIA